jgi:hypothetical protein
MGVARSDVATYVEVAALLRGVVFVSVSHHIYHSLSWAHHTSSVSTGAVVWLGGE